MTVLPGATASPAQVPPPPRRESDIDSSVVLPAEFPWSVSSVHNRSGTLAISKKNSVCPEWPPATPGNLFPSPAAPKPLNKHRNLRLGVRIPPGVMTYDKP